MNIVEILRSLLKNKIFWYLASRYGTFAIQFLTSIWLAVKLGPYYFGIWSFILLLINIGTQCNWGIANAVNILLVQHKEDMPKRAAYEFNALILTAAICLIPFGVAIYDTVYPITLFAKYHLGKLSYAIAFITGCFYLNLLFINILRVKNRILEIAINQSLFPILSFCVIFFATERALLYLLTGAYVVAMVVSIALFLRTRMISFAGVISRTIVGEILRKGFYLFLYNACFYLIMLSTKMIVSAAYPVESFGLFAFAFNVATATTLLVDSLMFLLFPKLIDILRGCDNAIIREKLSIMRIGYVGMLAMLFIASSVAFALLVKLMPQYIGSLPIFMAIAGTMLIYSFCFGYSAYMLAQNKEQRMSLYSLLALVVNVLAVYCTVYIVKVPIAFSLIGTSASYLIYVICVNRYSRRMLGITTIIPCREEFMSVRKTILSLFSNSNSLNI